VSDLHDLDSPLFVVHRVDDPVVPLAQSVSIVPRQPLAARRSRIFGQSPDACHDTAQIPLRYVTELTFR
jgi:hypothetical protein